MKVSGVVGIVSTRFAFCSAVVFQRKELNEKCRESGLHSCWVRYEFLLRTILAIVLVPERPGIFQKGIWRIGGVQFNHIGGN